MTLEVRQLHAKGCKLEIGWMKSKKGSTRKVEHHFTIYEHHTYS